jgi:hypothetical protein
MTNTTPPDHVKVEHIPTDPDNPYPLGRSIINLDPRNLNHLALVNPPQRATKPNKPWWTRDVYDQGNQPRCTAEAAVGMLRTQPFYTQFKPDWPTYDDPDERQTLYREAQQHDPWPGDNYEGSSVDAPLKVLRNRGHIAAWKWLLGETELREWVTWYGPAVVGTHWYTDMFNPDSDGYIFANGSIAGGHAYRITQYHADRDAYRIVNSWGRGWGQNGRAWIPGGTLNGLLQQDGEAVTLG